MMKAVQWCPSGSPFEGVPGPVLLLLSDNGITHGYGNGPGWATSFGTAQGDIDVLPTQWVVRHDDGSITVEDELPHGAEVFDAQAFLDAERAKRSGA